MRINIILLDENVIELQVDRSYTFLQLKELIGASQGYPPEDIVIMHLDDPSDNDTLDSKNIREGSYVKFGVICHERMDPEMEAKILEFCNKKKNK